MRCLAVIFLIILLPLPLKADFEIPIAYFVGTGIFFVIIFLLASWVYAILLFALLEKTRKNRPLKKKWKKTFLGTLAGAAIAMGAMYILEEIMHLIYWESAQIPFLIIISFATLGGIIAYRMTRAVGFNNN